MNFRDWMLQVCIHVSTGFQNPFLIHHSSFSCLKKKKVIKPKKKSHKANGQKEFHSVKMTITHFSNKENRKATK